VPPSFYKQLDRSAANGSAKSWMDQARVPSTRVFSFRLAELQVIAARLVVD
jgi:hypothetical protein